MSAGYNGGVFDLSQLKKDTQESAPASPEQLALEGRETIPGPFVVEVSQENLQNVIQTSMSLPVLVVFHSERSENSETLVTKLKDQVAKLGGQMQLASVDVESAREVTAAFGVTAVPAGAALLQGQPVPLFQGLPEDAVITETLGKILEAAKQSGLNAVLDGDENGVAPEPEVPPLHKEGLEALEVGNLQGAHDAYSRALKENPGDSEAKIALHQVELLMRIQEMNPEGSAEIVQEIFAAATEENLTDVEAHLKAADLEFSFGRADAAFGRLVEVVRVNQGDERNAARERLLALFDVAGPHSELVQAARKALTNALF